MESKNDKGVMNDAFEAIEIYLIYEEELQRSDGLPGSGEYSREVADDFGNSPPQTFELWICKNNRTIFIRRIDKFLFRIVKYKDLWQYTTISIADPEFFTHLHNIINYHQDNLIWKYSENME